jgi:hypothetical protein
MSDGLERTLTARYERCALPERRASDARWDDEFATLDPSGPVFDPHKDLFRCWVLRPTGFTYGRNGVLVRLDGERRR